NERQPAATRYFVSKLNFLAEELLLSWSRCRRNGQRRAYLPRADPSRRCASERNAGAVAMMNTKKVCVAIGMLFGVSLNVPAQTESLDKLADDFWTWRAKYAPFTGDDVNRIERPGGKRDWWRVSIDNRHKDLAAFEARWKKIDSTQWPIPQQVDYKLIGSALSRVRWELDINSRWQRDPTFYVEQTLHSPLEG